MRRKKITTAVCAECGRKFILRHNRGQYYCSRSCYDPHMRRCVHPTETQLRRMMSRMSVSAIARRHGVSDNAVRKWLRYYDIPTHPRGYWAKVYARKASIKEAKARITEQVVVPDIVEEQDERRTLRAHKTKRAVEVAEKARKPARTAHNPARGTSARKLDVVTVDVPPVSEVVVELREPSKRPLSALDKKFAHCKHLID